MTTEKQITALCSDPKVPDHIKKHFSADCAEKAMFAWCKRTGKEPIPQWWNLMASIRAYAEGKIAFETLKEIREAYRKADWGVDWKASRAASKAAYWAAYSAAYRAAAYLEADWAADWAADSAAQSAAYLGGDLEEEREWQLQHFHELIEQHDAQRSRLLVVLQCRTEKITQSLPEALKQYEEVLFT